MSLLLFLILGAKIGGLCRTAKQSVRFFGSKCHIILDEWYKTAYRRKKLATYTYFAIFR